MKLSTSEQKILNTAAGILLAAVVLCLLPASGLRLVGSLMLLAFLPGWCLWWAGDLNWLRRSFELRVALSLVGSMAVTPLVLIWSCWGHQVSTPRILISLSVVCLVMLLLGQRRRLKSDPSDDLSVMGETPGFIPWQRGFIWLMALGFTILVFCPFVMNGHVWQGNVAQSPCSGDWSKHRAVTVAVMDTGLPPRNPYLVHQMLSYYYAPYVEAAAFVRLGDGKVTVDHALTIQSLLLAICTVLLISQIALKLSGSTRGALLATALTCFVAGLDAPMIWLLRDTVSDWWFKGHVTAWAMSPRVTCPFINLHWALQHHTAVLLTIVLLWWLSIRRRGGWVTGGILLGGIVGSSIYLGLVAFATLFTLGCLALYTWARHQHQDELYRFFRIFKIVILGAILAGGIIWSATQMVENDRRFICLGMPIVRVADEVIAMVQHGLSARYTMLYPKIVKATGGTYQPPSATGQLLIELAAGWLGLIVQFGLLGIMGALGIRSALRNGFRQNLPILIGLYWAAGFMLFMHNFDLQIRSSALTWILLGCFSACVFDKPLRINWIWRLGIALLIASGIWTLTAEVGAMSRPAYFAGDDMRVFKWIRGNTPADAVVQGYPGYPLRIVNLPKPRYFPHPSYPEFTWRCAVMGDDIHVRMFETMEGFYRLNNALLMAWNAPTTQDAARLFRQQGVDYVVWTATERYLCTPAQRLLIHDADGFEVVYESGESFVARVKINP